MAKLNRRAGATSNIFQIYVQDTSSPIGGGLTGLTNGSTGLTAYFHRDTDTTATVINLVSMTSGTFTSSGFIVVDGTHMPGLYQFCPPDAAMASGASSVVFLLKGATNMAPVVVEVDLDPQVDVYLWNGTSVGSPATAGVPDVNVKSINAIATTSVTVVAANQGTTQPLNFTGTAGSALVKVDVTDIATAAVDVTKAQIGVNLVNVLGSASKGAAGYVGIDWAQIANPTAVEALTNTTISASSSPTAAQVATAVWQDATASDFTAASSIGKSLYTSGVVPGAAGGFFIAGANATTTVNFVGNLSGSVGSVTAAVTVDGSSPLTETYPSVGSSLTLASALYSMNQQQGEVTISGTTRTVRKRDGHTAAMTFTLNSATAPTASTQAT